MKIFLAQQNYHIGNFEENARKIIEGINKAKAAGADLVFAVIPQEIFWSSMILSTSRMPLLI